MAITPTTAVRIPPALREAAQVAAGPDFDLAALVRAGLVMLTGVPRAEALEIARGRRGPKPQPESSRR